MLLHNTQLTETKDKEMVAIVILLWNKSFESPTELRNHHSMVFNFEIHTPPLLKHNDSRSVVFANNICIKCLIIENRN